MPHKRVSAQRIKANRQYSYDELAETVGVTAQTVRSWRDEGMPVMMDQIPHLIMGYHAKDYLTTRKRKAKQSPKDHQVYCLRCKAPRDPFGMMADYIPINADRGRLKTLCGTCEAQCGRFVGVKELPRLSEKLEIAINSD